MRAKSWIIFFFLAAAPWLFSGCGTTLQPGEKGLKFKPFSSGLSDKPLSEGFYWHMPWNDVITYSTQWKNYKQNITCLTKDDLHIIVESSATIRPRAEELYQLQMEFGRDFYRQAVLSDFLGIVRSVIANYRMVDIPQKASEIEATISAALKERLRDSHIELRSVAVDHIEYSAGMLRAIQAKLVKEQETIQKHFEKDIAEQDVEIDRIKAKGAAEVLEIRAQGEAMAHKIIDETLTTRYLQFKAFDSPNAKFIYVPIGKDGLPIIVSPETK